MPAKLTLNTPSTSLLPSDFNDTDLCVMCGMCTPHCPTYGIYQTESESPRGRIAIIHAIANHQLVADDKALKHLNHCLGCRACETICPSNVPFMALMDKARQLTSAQYKSPVVMTRLLDAIRKPGGLTHHKNKLSFIQKSGLANLARLLPDKTGISKPSALLRHHKNTKLKDYYPAANRDQGSVLLFTGCMGPGFNSDSLYSSILLLNHFGFNVHIPANQHCCGALHQHHGQINNASELAMKNNALFQQYDIEAVLYLDSGCGTQLMQHNDNSPVYHMSQFILQQIQADSSHFKSCPQTVWLHESCSQRNSLRLADLSAKLLELIPDLSIRELNNPETCCGAGGSHFIEFPELADQLLAKKLDTIDPSQAQLLVSDNTGCSLHIKSGLKDRQLEIEVVHPVTLLARQLK